mmetsp:Transcript_4566/g.4690  ORF Transcript_4566/g.4690 Transcript_4566/m.4690 type:complete len:471 (-) Transcript_4566:35-1447(-)
MESYKNNTFWNIGDNCLSFSGNDVDIESIGMRPEWMDISNKFQSPLLSEIVSEMNKNVYPLVAICGLVILGSFAMAMKRSSSLAVLSGQISAIMLVFIPSLFPFKVVRFVLGLYCFCYSMSIESRILERLQKSPQQENFSLISETLKTVTFNSYSRLSRTAVKFPLFRIIHCIMIMLTIDTTVWLMEEIIPFALSPKNQTSAVGILGGVYVLYSMDLAYSCLAIFFDVIGISLPHKMRHRYPLLSTSLAEFWGVRWNPIVMKLLQETFYKPCRRANMPRIVSMAICFVGSAALHGIPQYFASFKLSDSWQMISFFLLQGLLVLFEAINSQFLMRSKDINSNVNEKLRQEDFMMANQPGQLLSFLQWLTETFTVGTIIYGIYLFLESITSSLNMIILVICFVTSTILFISAQYTANRAITTVQMTRHVLGWGWTLIGIISILPLFSMPVHNVFSPLYNRSIVVGRLVNLFF